MPLGTSKSCSAALWGAALLCNARVPTPSFGFWRTLAQSLHLAHGMLVCNAAGVLCDSEDPSREAAVALFKELGYDVKASDFIPFMGTGTNTDPQPR